MTKRFLELKRVNNYRKQYMYVDGINSNPITLKSRLRLTQGHWKHTALFHQKIGSTQQFKKEKEKKQQYKQDDNHLVTNVGSLQSRQLFVGIDCKQ